MIILPTLGRPLSLKRFVTHYYLTDATLPVHVVFDEADAVKYDNIGLPDNFKTVCVPTGTKLGDIYNLIFNAFPNEDFYGMVSDDCVPKTKHWDIKLRDACLPNKVSWPADGFINGSMPTFPFFGGDLIRGLGWWCPPGIKHWYTDNAWKLITHSLSIEAYLPDVLVEHLHPSNGNAVQDATYENQPNRAVDRVAFENFKRYELPSIIERLNGI
jgi:hypothetical protein